MKADKIFLIKTLEVPQNIDQDKMLYEFCECFDEDDAANYAVEDVNGLDYIFLRFPDYKVEKVCQVLDKYIKYSIEEITDNIIFDNQEDIREILKNPEYKPFFDSFRIENTKVDDVLDKILSKGIDSLDEIDKEILAKS